MLLSTACGDRQRVSFPWPSGLGMCRNTICLDTYCSGANPCPSRWDGVAIPIRREFVKQLCHGEGQSYQPLDYCAALTSRAIHSLCAGDIGCKRVSRRFILTIRTTTCFRMWSRIEYITVDNPCPDMNLLIILLLKPSWFVWGCMSSGSQPGGTHDDSHTETHIIGQAGAAPNLRG